MSRWARPVSIILAVLLVLLSAAACTKKSDDNQPSGSSASASPSTSQNDGGGTGSVTGDGGDGGWKPQSDLSKKIKFTYASVQGIEGYDYTKGDPLARYYSERFNYEMDVAALNWDNWNDRLRIWINSGDMPDVAVYNYIHADAASFVE